MNNHSELVQAHAHVTKAARQVCDSATLRGANYLVDRALLDALGEAIDRFDSLVAAIVAEA